MMEWRDIETAPKDGTDVLVSGMPLPDPPVLRPGPPASGTWTEGHPVDTGKRSFGPFKVPELPNSEHEIEVTREMIEAGLAEFLSFNDDYDDPKDCVISIFLAMLDHHRREG
jgi:hypothetical protein